MLLTKPTIRQSWRSLASWPVWHSSVSSVPFWSVTKPGFGDARQRAGVAAEQHVGQQQDDTDAAAPEGDAAGAADPTTVEDLARVESSIRV